MLDFNLNHLFQLVTWFVTIVVFLVVLKYRTETASVEIEHLKATKGKLYGEIGDLKNKIAVIERDIIHANSNIAEYNSRLVTSVTQFQVEMVRSEARIVAHVDTSFAAIKDIVKEALSAKS